jgi:hypothetical protein
MSFFNQYGFKGNPFEKYSAEAEPEIDAYIVKPPYYASVLARARTGGGFILFGGRGLGKSATRLGIYKELWKDVATDKKAPLVVTLDTFSRIHEGGLGRVSLSRYVKEVGYLVVEALLVWLSALTEPERDIYVDGLDGAEKALVVGIIDRFYLSVPEDVRQVTGEQAFSLLSQAWPNRTIHWLQKRWDLVTQVVISVGQAFVNQKYETNIDVDESLSKLLAGSETNWNEGNYARAVLGKLVAFARMFGFTGVTVLVDKVDETDVTSKSSEASAQLLNAVLSNTQLLEVDGFCWSFFIWDKVAPLYRAHSGPYSVRLDKIANAEIKWTDGFLRQMVLRRLTHYSSHTGNSLSSLLAGDINADDFLETAIKLSMKSPRELIRLLDMVFREHEDAHYGADSFPPVDSGVIANALDKYSRDAVERLYAPELVRQVVKLDRLVFTNNDVQARFRVNINTARNRIRKWVDAGLVSQEGSRPAEGGGGGKPAFEYEITDLRIARLVERDVLGDDDDVVIADDEEEPQEE